MRVFTYVRWALAIMVVVAFDIHGVDALGVAVLLATLNAFER